MWHELMRRLEGRLIALEPIREEHREPLRAAAAEREAPFVTIERKGDAVLGSTRYMTLRPEHRGVEVGNTWLARSAWSSGANVEAKLLMLEHAFERAGVMR